MRRVWEHLKQCARCAVGYRCSEYWGLRHECEDYPFGPKGTEL